MVERIPRASGSRCVVKTKLLFGRPRVVENFRRVPMREEVIGLEIFVQLDKMQIAPQFFARPARARLAVANHAAAFGNPAGLVQRPQRQNRARGVAPGIGHQLGLRDIRCIKFRQAVNRLTEPSFMRRRQLVPDAKTCARTESETRHSNRRRESPHRPAPARFPPKIHAASPETPFPLRFR